MSHTARVKVQFKSLEHLAAACQRDGLELVLDQTTFWTGRTCLHAIRPSSDEQKKAYAGIRIGSHIDFPIGVQASKAGTGFDLVFESMQGQFCRPAINELKKCYAAVAAIAAARKQGFRVQERRLASGEIKLLLSK